MRKIFIGVTAAALCGLMLFSACGPGAAPKNETQEAAQTEEVKEETKEEAVEETEETKAAQETAEAPEETAEAPEETAEAPEETAEAPEETAEAPEKEEEAASEKETAEFPVETAEAAEGIETVEEYAWLGLAEMPKCNYMDIFSTYHYIMSYDAYAMGFVTEEVEAVDGVDSYTENDSSLTFMVDGRSVSINKNAKTYAEYDMGSSADAAKENLESAKENKTNVFGRHFVGTGSGTVPLYSDAGDTAEYDYYEFDYPDYEEYGSSLTERYYMKDGDVFAVYSCTKMGETDYETVKIIKKISGDIPEGTFEIPDLSEYEKIEL